MPRDNEWLFTIYKQNPVGTRFVQMVSKKFSWDPHVPFTKFVQVYRGSLEGGKIMG